MSNLELILIAVMAIGLIWQLFIGLMVVAILRNGNRVNTVGFGPLLVAFIAFIAYLFVR